MSPVQTTKMTNWRWWICGLLFVATTVNYLDRQVLSLTAKEFIYPDFHCGGPCAGVQYRQADEGVCESDEAACGGRSGYADAEGEE